MKLIHLLLSSFFLFIFLITPSPTSAAYQENVIDSFAVGVGAKIIPVDCATAQDAMAIPCASDAEHLEGLGEWITGPDSVNSAGSAAVPGLYMAMASLVKNPPASAEVYVADLIHRINPVQTAYAQGVGFEALSPILPIWRVFRNFAYLFMIIIFMVVGLAIMFRAKLNPQTVISIQNALPQLVITLILISFSYAIAGLAIDIMYQSIFFILNVFDQFIFDTLDVKEIALDSHIFSNMLSLMNPKGFSGQAAQAIGGMVENMVNDGTFGKIFNMGTQVIAFLVIAVAILFQTFRVFFALLTSYVQIIIAVIFAPFQLLLHAYPGSNAFSSWFRSLLANLSVFPTVILMLLLVKALAGVGTKEGIGFQPGGGGFQPPQIGGTAGNVQALISLAIIMILPEVIKTVKEMMGVKESGLGAAVGGGLMQGTTPIRKLYGAASGTYQAEEQFKAQARIWGKPELDPYQKGNVRLGKTEKQVARAKEIGRRIVGW